MRDRAHVQGMPLSPRTSRSLIYCTVGLRGALLCLAFGPGVGEEVLESAVGAAVGDVEERRGIGGADDDVAGEASDADIAAHGGPFLAALANDLDTPTAIRELEALADSSDDGARRAGKALAMEILGLTLKP